MIKINQFSQTDYEPVELTNQINERIRIEPIYFNSGFSPKSNIYSRAAVLNNLIKALELLPADYGFLIWDVYRPREIQAKIFNWMSDEIRKKFPHLSDEENYKETQKFASPPPKSGKNYCPPHLSGGAIDLTLFQTANGSPLEMGTPFDDCTERAHSDYFQLKTMLTSEEVIIKKNRQLLRSVMEEVGFVSYQYEWWHFDMGNLFWSRRVQQPEVFGPLFGDAEWPVEG